MKKLVGFAVVALLVVGIVKVVSGRGDEAHARKACQNVIDQCGAFFNEKKASDLDDCTQAFLDGKKQLGDKYASQYDDLTTCVADAGNCGEVLGCMTGAAADEIGKQVEGFGRGFDKMTKH